MTDANEIPDREAFEWYKCDTGKGMALWYKNSGPWWGNRYSKPNDGISLEEEKPDSNSIYNFYKKVIGIRKNNPIISEGTYETLINTNDSVFCYQRYDSAKAFIVAVNLSASPQNTEVNYSTFDLNKVTLKQLIGNGVSVSLENKFEIKLPAYGIEVVQLNL